MIDPTLQMFISTCCSNCTNSACTGALSVKDRATCKKYSMWQQISGEKRSRLYIEASTGTLITLERIKNGR